MYKSQSNRDPLERLMSALSESTLPSNEDRINQQQSRLRQRNVEKSRSLGRVVTSDTLSALAIPQASIMSRQAAFGTTSDQSYGTGMSGETLLAMRLHQMTKAMSMMGLHPLIKHEPLSAGPRGEFPLRDSSYDTREGEDHPDQEVHDAANRARIRKNQGDEKADKMKEFTDSGSVRESTERYQTDEAQPGTRNDMTDDCPDDDEFDRRLKEGRAREQRTRMYAPSKFDPDIDSRSPEKNSMDDMMDIFEAEQLKLRNGAGKTPSKAREDIEEAVRRFKLYNGSAEERKSILEEVANPKPEKSKQMKFDFEENDDSGDYKKFLDDFEKEWGYPYEEHEERVKQNSQMKPEKNSPVPGGDLPPDEKGISAPHHNAARAGAPRPSSAQFGKFTGTIRAYMQQSGMSMPSTRNRRMMDRVGQSIIQAAESGKLPISKHHRGLLVRAAKAEMVDHGVLLAGSAAERQATPGSVTWRTTSARTKRKYLAKVIGKLLGSSSAMKSLIDAQLLVKSLLYWHKNDSYF